MGRFTGILGLLAMLGLAYVFSTNRRAIRLKTVAWGLGLQLAFAVFVLKADIGRRIFQAAGNAVNRLLSYSFEGSKFVFGELGKQGSSMGFFFAFQVLPTIIFIAAFFAVLYHYGVMQFIIKQVARVMTRVMGASGAESLNVAASIFMGQTEAPLTIRPFLPDLTNSELMTVMTSGMAHVSGGIMAAYIAFGIDPKHLLSAVIMTAPGTLLMSKMLVPETEQPKTAGRVVMNEDEVAAEKSENVLGAIARGTTDGLHLSLNIAAMLISFLALIALVNGLLGTRMVLNELVAFSMLGPQRAALDPRSFTIATFALCGFANLSSIGIQIGGIGALAPNRRGDLARLGVRAMLAGTMANLMSASIAGLLY
jgi:CNT family concentrative nucleoside transporter